MYILFFSIDKSPPKDWPKFGKIVFENVSLRYSPDTPQVLKNLNFVIQPMEKVILKRHLNLFMR